MSLLHGVGGLGGAGDAGGALASSSIYSHTINQSLRCEDGDTAWLQHTSGAASSTYTLSMWFKRGNLSTYQYLWSSGNNGIGFDVTTDRFYVWVGSGQFSTARFLDTNAWYHVTYINNSNSASVYINGVEIMSSLTGSTLSTASNATNIARYYSSGSGNYYFDGYIAEVHFVADAAKAATDFGEFTDGVWIPKNYTGSHGSHGYYLPFDDSSAIGDDESANTNDFTVTDFVASDVVSDSPTNNFATLTPLSKGSGTITFSEGNLKSSTSANLNPSEHGATFTIPKSGKWYWEAAYTGAYTNGGVATMMGIMDIDTQTVGQSGNHINNTTGDYITYYSHNSGIYENNTLDSSFSGNETAATVGFALDMDNGYLFIHLNGTYIGGTPNFSTGANHAAEPNKTRTWLPFFGASGGGAITWRANFGQDSEGISSAQSPDNGIGTFEYDVPADYKALCSSNLPSPVITDGSEHFTPYIYTANNASTRSFTGLGFQPDFLWFKARNQAFSHRLFNSVVGVGTHAYADRTDRPAWDSLTSFDADGFSTETDGTAGNLLNYSTSTYVAWAWKAGTAASGSESGNNPAFSSSSNADAGFSIVSYTGTGSAGTVSHGCGAKPTMIMIKNRTADENWAVYHAGTASDPETDYMILNLVNAVADSANWWNDTAPTDSVFTVGTDHTVNADGEDYIAYCFANVDGYMKSGMYIGGNTTPVFVHTGFRPAFLILKKTTQSTTYGWQIYDTSRSPYNVLRLPGMWADTGVAEAADTYSVNIHSNGFRLTGAGDNQNAAGVRYVYFAIADQPQKFSNAR